MEIADLLADRTRTAKRKAKTISQWLLKNYGSVNDFTVFVQTAGDVDKSICIEALEFATRQNPEIADHALFAFVTMQLSETAPRVKSESARVVGNIAHRFPDKLDEAITNLLINAEDNGTVVRWAAAFALGEMLKLQTKHNKDLLPAIEAICEREKDNGIKKKYLDAIKKTRK